jgi:hypothetical protein
MKTERIYDGIGLFGDEDLKIINFKIIAITGLALIGIGALTLYFFRRHYKSKKI